MIEKLPNGTNAIDGAAMSDMTDAAGEMPEPERKKRAGYTRSKGQGTPKHKRKMTKRSRRINRK